jgi:hypothetical protein
MLVGKRKEGEERRRSRTREERKKFVLAVCGKYFDTRDYFWR